MILTVHQLLLEWIIKKLPTVCPDIPVKEEKVHLGLMNKLNTYMND